MVDEPRPPTVYELLDGDAFAILRKDADALVPLTFVASSGVRSLPLFSAAALAERHLDALPEDVRNAYDLTAFDSDDHRGKEEVLRAALAAEVFLLEVDPDLTFRASVTLATSRALSYVLSFRRETACL